MYVIDWLEGEKRVVLGDRDGRIKIEREERIEGLKRENGPERKRAFYD